MDPVQRSMTNARSNSILRDCGKPISNGREEEYEDKRIQKGGRGSDSVSLEFTDLTYRTERRGLMKDKLFCAAPFSFHFVKVCWSEASCDVLIASILCCAERPPVAARYSSSQQWGLYVHKTSSFLRLSDPIPFSSPLVSSSFFLVSPSLPTPSSALYYFDFPRIFAPSWFSCTHGVSLGVPNSQREIKLGCRECLWESRRNASTV